MTIRLFSYRFYKVFSMTRPFFSDSHNIIIAAACFVYYTLALIGFYADYPQKETRAILSPGRVFDL
jgi:hypothetical protein